MLESESQEEEKVFYLFLLPYSANHTVLVTNYGNRLRWSRVGEEEDLFEGGKGRERIPPP